MTPEISAKIDKLSHTRLIDLACAFAEHVLPLFTSRFRGDLRPLGAIQEARKTIAAPREASPGFAAGGAITSFYDAAGKNKMAAANAAKSAHYAALAAIKSANAAYNCKAAINFATAAVLERAREVAETVETKRQDEFFIKFFDK